MEHHFLTASKQIRIVNFFIDHLILGIFIQTVWVLFYYDFDLHTYTVESFFKRIFSVFIAFFYFLITEAVWGKSIGKVITKTHVSGLDNAKPLFLQILVRSAVRIVPFDPLSFLGMAHGGWHDLLSKTKVVRDI